MKSSKVTQFRETIRRKQINQIIKKRRRFDNNFQERINVAEQMQSVEVYKTLMNDLNSSMLRLDYFEVLENLKQISKLMKKSSNYVIKNVSKADNMILQKITQIFELVYDSQLTPYQLQPIFHKGISILNVVLSNQQIKQQRLIQANTLSIIKKLLSIQMNHPVNYLCNLFSLIGNTICQSLKLASQLVNINLHQDIFRLFSNINPNPHDTITKQFLFTIRCLFDQFQTQPPLSQWQFTICQRVVCESTNQYLKQNISNKQIMESLQDSIKLLNKLADYRILKLRSKYIPYQDLIDILSVAQYPTSVKKQILFFLDTIVVLDDNVVTGYLVRQQQMLMKMWGVQAHLKYIVYNIFGNVALEGIFKDQIRPFLTPIRLQFLYNSQDKQILTFIYNYFHSQNFQIQTQIQKTYVDILREKQQPSRQQIYKLIASLWLRLLAAGNQYIPPTYLINNQQLSECQSIRQILKQKEQYY